MANYFDQFDQGAQNNYFDKFDRRSKEQKQPQEQSSFMNGVEAFNRQFGRMAEGALDIGAGIVGTVGGALPVVGGAIQEDAAALQRQIREVNRANEASARRAAEESPVAATVGGVAGAIGAGAAFGGPGIGAAASIPAKVAAGAGAGAALGAVDYAETSGERLRKAAIGGAIGGAIPLGVASVKAGWNAVGKYITKPRDAALSELTESVAAEGIRPGGVRQATATAREILGEPLTPGQTFQRSGRQAGAEIVAPREAGLLLEEGAKAQAAAKSMSVTKKVRDAVQETIDDIAPKGTKELKNQLYSELKEAVVDDGTLDSLKQNQVIADTLEDIGASKYSTLKDVPDNAVIKLDAVKKRIDDALRFDVFGEAQAKLQFDEKEALKQAKAQLTGTLDELTGYSQARKEAQKLITQNFYKDVLKKKKTDATVKDINNALFGSQEKVDMFLQDIENVGGDPIRAAKIIELTGDLADNTLLRAMKRQAQVGTPLSTRFENLVERFANKMTGNRYNQAVIDIITEDNWVEDVEKALASQNRVEQTAGLAEVLLDAAGEGTQRATAVGAARMSE